MAYLCHNDYYFHNLVTKSLSVAKNMIEHWQRPGDKRRRRAASQWKEQPAALRGCSTQQQAAVPFHSCADRRTHRYTHRLNTGRGQKPSENRGQQAVDALAARRAYPCAVHAPACIGERASRCSVSLLRGQIEHWQRPGGKRRWRALSQWKEQPAALMRGCSIKRAASAVPFNSCVDRQIHRYTHRHTRSVTSKRRPSLEQTDLP